MPSGATSQQQSLANETKKNVGSSADLETYMKCGYTALSNAVVDFWMSGLSGSEFKVFVFFLRSTVGDRDKRFRSDLTIRMPVSEISEKTGLDREAAITAIRNLERRGLVSAWRAHRQTTLYTLDLSALIGPWVGNPDSSASIKVGNPDLELDSRVGKTDSRTLLESGNPTLNGTFESGIPTPYKETNKAATAIPSQQAEKTVITPGDEREIRRISGSTGVRIDGKDAMRLKAGAESAGLTLAHLRWFLAQEKLLSARNPKAVLLTIAKEFPERAQGIRWPDSLDPTPQKEQRGLTGGEILRL